MVRMYSSSPPPLEEDGEEEDEDDFGEFGGYCCDVSSSFSFSEYDMPTAFDQSYEMDTSPPNLYNTPTRSVSSPEKDLALEEEEKIHTESLECETGVAVDCKNEKMGISKVLINGPLSSDSQEELSVDSITAKHRTFKLQGLKLAGKDKPNDNPYTAQAGHCLSNGPITVGKEQPTGTSALSTESVLAFRAEGSCTASDKVSATEGPIYFHQLLEDNISLRGVSEARDTPAKQGITESLDVDSSLSDEDQSSKGKTERKETEEDLPLSGLCGPSGGSFSEIEIQSACDNFEDVASTSLALVEKNYPVSEAQLKEKFDDSNETSVSPGIHEPSVVPGTEYMEEDFKDVDLPVGHPTMGEVQDVGADLVKREVKRIAVGSSVESDEDFGDFRDSHQGFSDVSQTESISREGFADFVTALSDCSSHDEFADTDTLKDLKEEDETAAEDKDDDDDQNIDDEMTCSELPPSDSFADFSSAPFGGLAGTTGESWAEFGQNEGCEVQQESWAAFDNEQQGEQQGNNGTAPSIDSLQTDNLLVSYTCFISKTV